MIRLVTRRRPHAVIDYAAAIENYQQFFFWLLELK
jgi:Cu2+-containing amine oxidase